MELLEGHYTEFEVFKEAPHAWDLDFRLLSKGEFDLKIVIIKNEKFHLGRTTINGKLEQKGNTPKGFITMGISANTNHLVWVNRDMHGQELLLFPSNGYIDSVSFDGFDMYTVSIEEEYLSELLDALNYNNARKFFDGTEKHTPLTTEFIEAFHEKANSFIDDAKIESVKSNTEENNIERFRSDEIIVYILRYIEGGRHDFINSQDKKRDTALKEAVGFINNETHLMPSIPDLCEHTGVSERTLGYAFMAKYKVSPKEYIIATKLLQVKKELLLGKTDEIKISDIAVDYGFWHMGKFSADYKKKFGELPSATLRRSLMF